MTVRLILQKIFSYKSMNSIKFSSFLVLAVVFAVSCKPIYKCGEQKPTKKLLVPKVIRVVIDERDSLCTTLSDRENQIAGLIKTVEGLNSTIDRKNAGYDSLTTKYNDLISKNISESEQYSLAIKQKTEELSQKSALLFDKEQLLLEREKSLKELQKIIDRQDSITKRLNSIIRNALLGFKSDELSVEVKNGKVYVSMSDKLLFKSGSAAIEDKGIEAIKLLADVLNKNNDIDILIEGHTDNLPIKTAVYQDNWDLSVARATSIVRILTDNYKVSPARLTASGKGEYAPRANNATAEGRARNRRTEIILSPKLDEIMNLLKSTN